MTSSSANAREKTRRSRVLAMQRASGTGLYRAFKTAPNGDSRALLLRSTQRPDVLQLGDIEDPQDAVGKFDDAAIAEKAKNPAHMNRRESDGIGDVLLAQRKRIALLADHIPGRDALHQM